MEQDSWINAAEAQVNHAPTRIALGLHEGLSNHDYHADEAVGSTGLKRILVSPAHFRYPNPFNATRAKEIGSAIHCRILESDRWDKDYKVVECDARTSALYKAACKDHPKERVLTSGEYENVLGMQKGCMRNPRFREIIESEGKYELSLFTNDPETGVPVKVRYDKLDTNILLPFDLKKTQKADRYNFSKAIQSYGYHISAALYTKAWEWQYGEKMQRMHWGAIEEQSPHIAMVYRPDDEMMVVADMLLRQALITYAECLDTDNWHGYLDDSEEISLPQWALEQSDEVEIDFGDEE
jgi:exodeoxyribonuclease VIII